jgi:hypothetical protein
MGDPEWEIRKYVEWNMQWDLRKSVGEDIQRDLEDVHRGS